MYKLEFRRGDRKKALEYVKMGESEDVASLTNVLGNAYEYGRLGVKKDEYEAFKCYKKGIVFFNYL